MPLQKEGHSEKRSLVQEVEDQGENDHQLCDPLGPAGFVGVAGFALDLCQDRVSGAGDHTQAGVLTGLTQHKDDEHDADEHLNDRENGNSHN